MGDLCVNALVVVVTDGFLSPNGAAGVLNSGKKVPMFGALSVISSGPSRWCYKGKSLDFLDSCLGAVLAAAPTRPVE